MIKTHDFDQARNRIRVFSQQAPIDLQFNKVETEGGFLYLGDHRVTGTELNDVTVKIQALIFDINRWNEKVFEEFGDVYSAFDALDKDYIKWIIKNIEAVKKTSEEVKVAQVDIKNNYDIQKKTITKFSEFKKKIESYEHLGDVDKLWDDSLQIFEDISSIKNDVKRINSTAGKQLQAIDTLYQFKATLEECEHLNDIDLMWSQSESIKKDISCINQKQDDTAVLIDRQGQSIGLLMQFKDNLENYMYIEKLDAAVDKQKNIEMDLINSRDKINVHEEQITELKNYLQKMKKQNDEASQSFSRKLKIANVLAGSFLGIAILELFILMSRIM